MDDQVEEHQLCPFCGSGALMMLEDADRFTVACLVCASCGPLAENAEAALSDWSDRYDPYEESLFGARRSILVN